MTPAIDPEHLIRAVLDGVDHVAGECERRWGVGRLRLLIGDELRARFDAQRRKLDAAVEAGLAEQVQIHGQAMKRAWQALDRAAAEAGCPLLSPEVWECQLPSGQLVAICRTAAEASLVTTMPAFTLAEVGQAIEALGETLLTAKVTFPGATISAIRDKPTINWDVGDEIPF